MDTGKRSPWQILDVGSIWMREFASALAKVEETVAWWPEMERFGVFQSWQREESLANPPLTMLRFPLQRGYARQPLRTLAPFGKRVLKMLHTQTDAPEETPLVCSTPYYAPVAELWPGPLIYYSTDMTVAYPGLDAPLIRQLDRRMCRVARVVCPNSRRIADYFVDEAGCDREKIAVVPNATRQSNVQLSPQYEPGPLPNDVADLPRPIAGVLGDLSGNMDWELVVGAMKRTPEFSWLFVGPAEKPILEAKQQEARAWAKGHARFVGMKPYGELQMYARCVDAAVLPYRKKEPTYSGSSTRFYEHLAAGRPMVATRGFAELLEKEPLLKLVDTAEEAAAALAVLRSQGFRDSQEEARWEASKVGTWEERARMMRSALEDRQAIPL
jgi:glycosyltransferase involved in cell wall biosynthesis